jgi:hypothetical protein
MPKNATHSHMHAEAYADETVTSMLARLAGQVLVVLKNGSAVVVEDQFASYDFPVENRERDRRVLKWAHDELAKATLQSNLERGPQAKYSDADKIAYAEAYLGTGGTVAGETVAPYKFSAKLGDTMSLLDECIDRVRWDAMVASGKRSGKYDDFRKAADIEDRAEDCAAIRKAITGDNPGLMCSHIGQPYLDLVIAKADEVQGIRHPVRTRKAKGDKEKIAL